MNRKETTKHHARDINRKEKKKRHNEQRLRRKERKKSGKPAGIPQTLETLRTPDETILPKDDVDVAFEEQNVCCSHFFYFQSGRIHEHILWRSGAENFAYAF